MAVGLKSLNPLWG